MQIRHLMDVPVRIVAYAVVVRFCVLLQSKCVRLSEERLLLSPIHGYLCGPKYNQHQYRLGRNITETFRLLFTFTFIYTYRDSLIQYTNLVVIGFNVARTLDIKAKHNRSKLYFYNFLFKFYILPAFSRFIIYHTIFWNSSWHKWVINFIPTFERCGPSTTIERFIRI